MRALPTGKFQHRTSYVILIIFSFSISEGKFHFLFQRIKFFALDSRQGQEIYMFTKGFWLAVEPTQPPIQRKRIVLPGGKAAAKRS